VKRNLITITGKVYYASDFYNVPIYATKKTLSFFVRQKDKKYLHKTFDKGQFIGNIYFITDEWTTFRLAKNKFFHIKTEDIKENLIKLIKSKEVKSASEQKKELEQKFKKPSIWQNINTTLLLALGLFAIAKK